MSGLINVLQLNQKKQIKTGKSIIIKTHKTLLTALTSLLDRRSFIKLTVNDICGEAWLSRTAFYAHFQDKYDLLKYWLGVLADEILAKKKESCGLEGFINDYIGENKRIIVNVLKSASAETLNIVKEFILRLLELPPDWNGGQDDHRVVADFCVGGIFNCLQWQIENDFPTNLQFFNSFLHSAICATKNILLLDLN